MDTNYGVCSCTPRNYNIPDTQYVKKLLVECLETNRCEIIPVQETGQIKNMLLKMCSYKLSSNDYSVILYFLLEDRNKLINEANVKKDSLIENIEIIIATYAG